MRMQALSSASSWRTAMIERTAIIIAVAAALALNTAPRGHAIAPEKFITVFAAASLKNAVDDINAIFAKNTGMRIAASYAASSALMKQIEQGAPADVFVSADIDWMDHGAQKALMRSNTRMDLLGNRLVLIAPSDAQVNPVQIQPGFDLAALAGTGRIVSGDVRAVPVGRYAKSALEKLGIWAKVEGKLAMTENVRAALALVARGEAPLGIVYATDAKIEPKVKVIGTFPADSHAPIIYPAALTAIAKPAAAEYLAFLRSAEAKSIFEKYGFTVLAQPAS
jgi:molybdate transport system substrate-binding protein